MTKTFKGIWFQTKVLCPECLVQPGDINNYGTDQQGFWFKAICPHCRNKIKWYRNADLSLPEVSMAAGEQMSMFNDEEKSLAYRRKIKRKKGKDNHIIS